MQNVQKTISPQLFFEFFRHDTAVKVSMHASTCILYTTCLYTAPHPFRCRFNSTYRSIENKRPKYGGFHQRLCLTKRKHETKKWLQQTSMPKPGEQRNAAEW